MSDTRLRVDGVAQAQVSALDRGLLYGDGLFETVLFVAGAAPLWPRHWQRLGEGARRLQLALPDAAWLLAEARSAAAGLARAVVRITLTRGVGERGYAPPPLATPTCIVAAAPAAALPADWYAQGIRVRCCSLRLGAQPLLAGIKHLNRLEQVLARAEWQDDRYAEGLLRDTAGHVIGATAANLFARIGDELVTPALDDCGIAGVTRAEVLARHAASVRRLTWEELMRAEEIFLTSSVRGILPVCGIDTQDFAVGALTRRLQQEWRALGLLEPHHG
jgi:4-amino-4-deoxychorismate lyase